MRKEYDFSKMKGRKNPYAKRLKKQVTIRMGVDIIEYFKRMSEACLSGCCTHLYQPHSPCLG